MFRSAKMLSRDGVVQNSKAVVLSNGMESVDTGEVAASALVVAAVSTHIVLLRAEQGPLVTITEPPLKQNIIFL